MTQPTDLTRRAVMGGFAALPLLPAAGWADAPMKGVSTPLHRRFKLGAFEVTMLLSGTIARGEPQSIFGLNASKEDFAAASAAANIPNDQAQFFFTPVVVNTGEKLVLFDTGLSPDSITAALEDAGYSADQVDMVVLTHMHGDHIGGLMGDAGETFNNAQLFAGQAEFDYWAKEESDAFEGKVRPLADKISMVGDGASGFSGHTAMAAFGHTPGHMVHMLESEGQQLLIAADFANHYVWSLAHPDWHVRFDIDKEAAAKTRRRLLDMIATDKLAFTGYHMPWPAVGYVEAKDGGFRYVPSSYQLML
ncbi:MAG: MBL fold metallo-hydrolase [Pseudomonadota bacterium]